MARIRLSVLLVVLLALGAAGWWSARLADVGIDEPPSDLVPAGRWHRVAEDRRRVEQARAQLLSLGYLPGRFAAPAGSGVRVLEEDRVWPGVSLYTSGDGPVVRLIDLEGRILHRWERPYRSVFPDGLETGETDYVRRARLLEGGDLIVLYQGGGIARLDANANVRWAVAEPAFNDLEIGAGGVLRTLVKRPTLVAEWGGREVLEDFVVELALDDGAVRRRTSILGALRDSPFQDVLEPLPDGADVLHGNTVRTLAAGAHEPFAAGQWLVSLREIDTVAVIDPASGRPVWAQRGPWRRQHDPTLLPGGRLLLFDNRGDGGSSRALELEVESGVVIWQYRDVDSPEAGTCRRLPNGSTLITESERGRALEIAAAGEIVWEFVSPHRAGGSGELIATLFEVERYRVEGDWLERQVEEGPELER
ncbi:MAG TPA: arylsulfotransferase family protein [Thermoanaerobaculia bacterium]|nr:arylsulfotransferase family protein [Thermoanaerobaculia bacterium]